MMTSAVDLHLIAHRFNPDSLKIAREYRGWKKNDLAKRIGITPSAISQFESGQSRPNANTVARCAMALGFPAAFFEQSSLRSLSHDHCHFRSLRSCSPIERRKMLSAGSMLAYIVDYVDDQIHLPNERISAVADFQAETVDDIDALAMHVRKSWGLGLGPLENVTQLLESNGVVIFRLMEECKKIDAFSFWHRDRPLIFLNSEKESSSRNRFDAAHELGHFVMHADYLPGDPAQEAAAHYFAGAFLLPRESFVHECPRRLRWEQFIELKRRWGVSLAALVRRAKDLHMISQDTFRRAMVQIGKRGWRTNEPVEPPVETPTVISGALRMIAGHSASVISVCEKLGLPERETMSLIYGEYQQPQLFHIR
jgi:Zn-dependent peptidase ImmA (M78 family)/transcriptional regulator with XRE-family HTH domain